MKRVLVTGSLGYIGSVLMPYLSHKGFDCVGYDTGLFRSCLLKPEVANRTVRLDARNITESNLEGINALVHLAGISNDPMNKMDEKDVYDPTRKYASDLAKMCKRMGISFIFASSCSVYGIGGAGLLDEESETRPQTGYSRNKLQIEDDLKAMSDSSFSPIALRFATVYGPSPRIRFDVVVNMLAGMAVSQGQMVLNSDGLSWRPNLHILDLCESIRCCLNWNYRGGDLMVLNVGDEKDNYSIMEIAKEVQKAIPKAELKFLHQNPGLDKKGLIGDRKVKGSDTRTYRVSFAKIRKTLPGFRCQWTLQKGIPNLVECLQKNKLTKKIFQSRKFYRLQHLEDLIKKGKLTNDLRWQKQAGKKTKNSIIAENK